MIFKYVGYSISAVLFIAVFVFSTVENGFSWDNVLGALFVVLMVSSLIMLNYFITLNTTSYLKKKNFSFANLWEFRQDPKQFFSNHTNKNIVDKTNEQ